MNKRLLTIAREAIEAHFKSDTINKSALLDEYPDLREKGASFVTLTQNGQLRGCIGSVVAYRPLLEDIISNAQAAAFADPRFMPLEKDELENTKIEVSQLSPPVPVEYNGVNDLKDKIRIGIDGVILKIGERQATFLPQVWDELKEFESFFSHLCRKANLSTGCLYEHPEIYTYQVEKVKEI